MRVEPASDALRVVPLGGCGEVGLNATLLTVGGRSILIDCGALLGVHNAPGVEKAVPGFEPLFAGGRKLDAVVLTHGHEDHIGALPALLAELDVPVFGTPTTLDFVRARLERDGGAPSEARSQRGRLVEVPLGGHVDVGPFSVELVRVTHSMPESAALFIETPAGRVLHSGDFKLDPTPIHGPPTDVERLRAIGDAGVELMLSDSTNSERSGHGASETEVASTIDRLIASAPGRVVVTLFASHLHRLRAVMQAALRNGRRVVLVGRSLENAYALGLARGILPADPSLLVRPERLGAHARNKLVVVASGSQGEWQGGFHRVAMGQDAALRCLPGDRVVVSARTIPGREPQVRRLMNLLLKQGAEVVTDRMATVHCSGHAHAGEQADLLQIVRPRHLVPVHGDRAMLEAHARTARGAGLADDQITVVEDGQSVVLTGGKVHRGPDEVVSQRALDGGGRLLDWGDVRDRNKIGRTGLLTCSVVMDQRGQPTGRPAITFRGRREPATLVDRAAHAVMEALARPDLVSEVRREEAVRAALRRVLKTAGSVVPELQVHLHTVDGEAR
ncbi:MAG: ribonuclease J [Deltaproteobacteria bacterium]|nr:ribonuclease J [Deltaproteobacteria bacterium]